MNKIRIVIIGLGGIGFRHFQSLMAEKKHELEVTLVDVEQSALSRAKEYEEQNKNYLVNVNCTQEITKRDSCIDIAIIATSSLVRRKVFEELIERAQVKNIIFEKFLFPRVSDYPEVKNILEEKGIKAFVNCPCRLYPGYISLKKELLGIEHIDAILTGSNWGLACNVIHTIDMLGFLLDTYDDLKVDALQLDAEIQEAKRKGYIEFTGRLICEMGDKINVIFDSDKTGDNPFKLTIYAQNRIYTISEVNQKMWISYHGENEEREFPIYYQSQLTALVVDELIETGKCSLTNYNDTMQWHMALLEAFRQRYSEITGSDKDICPIT